MSQIRKPRIAITMGDPCGIGPEILVKALCSKECQEQCLPVIIGDPLPLKRAMELLGKNLKVELHESILSIRGKQEGIHLLNPVSLSPQDMFYGHPTRNTCLAIVKTIEMAVHLALDGDIDAICTCPIHKAHLHRHGFHFPGHTEFIGDLAQTEDIVMMLAGPRLRVSLVTIHHALADIPNLLTRELLQKTLRITGEALVKDFGIQSPHVAIAALNPHAGEEGRFGEEEIRMIAPALEEFQGKHYQVTGPYPSDTVFYRAFMGEFDAVVAMHHDQGLIPIKLVHFEEAVNVTLGLPIIRTSVDHGTAYDIAGSGQASEKSLKSAISLAALMVHNRRFLLNTNQ